jgi:uncharacterized membrane protein
MMFKTNFTWRYLLIIILALGIFFRFVNLDQKVYWHDETITSVRLSGYTKDEFAEKVTNGQVIKIEDLQKYQQPNPNKSLFATIRSLAIENPEHPPLYYMLARLWVQSFSNGQMQPIAPIQLVRSFSAVMSLLAFPLMYWLCRELFELPLTGWVAIALLAVSPFHVIYAQEARGYSLWTVTILLSCAALLRAMRMSKSGTTSPINWGIYTITLILGLYTSLLSGLVAVGQGIYVIVSEKFQFSKTVIAYLVTSFLGFLAFFPWLFLMVTNFDDIDWIGNEIPLLSWVTRLVLNLNALFFDIASGYKDQFIDVKNGYDSIQLNFSEPLLYASLPILLTISYAIYWLCHTTPKKVWVFILILMGTTALPLLLKDTLGEGQRSTISRYLIPCYLGIQLAVAYLLSTKITSISTTVRQQKFWQILLVMLISAGILSCSISAQADTWWNKYSSYYNPPVAQIINKTTQPLVISSNPIRLTSLSYMLDPKVRLMLVKEPNVPKISNGFSDVFLFRPAKTLKSGFEREKIYRVDSIHKPGDLWQLNRL